jgi:hypothetical protein
MRQVTLTRDDFTGDRTLGKLECDTGEVFHVLELPWRGNEPFRSCIPLGEYPVEFLPKAGDRKNVWLIKNVLGRSEVLIHTGNWVINPTTGKQETFGCPLIGMYRGVDMVCSSRIALGAFNNVMGREDFILNIRNRGENRRCTVLILNDLS